MSLRQYIIFDEEMNRDMNMTWIWLSAAVILLIVEGIAPGLVSVWFALGALAAMVSAICNAPLWLQAVWFVLVSAVALVLTRPLVKKYVNSRVQPTNADALIGKDGVVVDEIDNIAGTGSVKISGQMWTARSTDENIPIASGKIVTAKAIQGVKLIVEEKEN